MVNPFAEKGNKGALDNIIKKMISTVESSREEVFEFSEVSRTEYETLKIELVDVQNHVEEILKQGDELDILGAKARARLSDVSKNFSIYSEEEVRTIYEEAYDIHGKIQLLRQAEVQFIQRRNDLERRLVSLSKQMERAESLSTQINVVFNYLTKDFQQIGELVEDARQKQEFGFRIIEAQEEERKRLSREIHDGPAQTLAHILIRSDLLERIGRERGLDLALEEMKTIREYVRSALYEVRRLIYDLRPMALDDLGLIPTLNKYLKTVEEYKGIPVEFVHRGSNERIPANFEVACFRLIQEAVQNACKHANPTTIQVNVEMMLEQIILLIKDNGQGFLMSDTKEGSFGMLGMKERVDLLNGKLEFNSEIGKGTSVFISIPFTN